ncbi:D-beta-D-heptose 7-phosphate kinase / D-beta-D-heptose 1-phosphate adenosyltransferase [Prosthecobacter debontii]|uniref:D-beta-D-heptose 7-phosphate kinase / D-beta-D-heptose 1-phosphate adenosyltransferase n=1 Tax=Prosthecobacter debontii TaxID=48467 RepID=A0A1T4YW20_9BACT|nr:D-glycero-beta-D-manno-heptose-7-phosphate kinase [Prosthecobacter debontii]SKB05833.1 D-beta-D-heptose 7-phosphate kinase / D-beta-D-heptose 1-phosphate adenosyltransferase [Prosthecobacter debontii]
MLTLDSARDAIQRMAGCRILVIGDVMLDHFIWGAVRRISPEAPVPIVEVTKETTFPGGAANVARNLSAFTPHSFLMGRVGKDSAANELKSLLNGEGVNTDPMLESSILPTIAKTRIIARQQHVVRVDRETIEKLSADELKEVCQKVEAMLPELDGIIVEDYGKGFVTQALADQVLGMAKAAGKLVTVDPSPRNPLSWRGATLVKPNRLEAFAAAGIQDHRTPGPPLEDRRLLEVGEQLLDQWSVGQVLVTLGELGMILFQRDRAPHHIPTRAREVYDVSGAGDTAIAFLTLALAAGLSSEDAANVANRASGIVVGKLGTARLTMEELLQAFED